MSFCGPNVNFTNDKYPISKKHPENYQKTIIEKGVSIGAGAIIMGGITIGENSLIGAGALINKNIPKNAVVYGSPGEVKYYK